MSQSPRIRQHLLVCILSASRHWDPARTLAMCRLLAADRDDMVVKAISWALRSLAERDPEAVWTFLILHGDAIAARARRETMHKSETGLKNLRRHRG